MDYICGWMAGMITAVAIFLFVKERRKVNDELE